MRIETATRGTFTAGQTINHTIGKGHLNGLLFMSTSNSHDASITIRRRGKAETRVLAANLRMSEAFRISDLDFGYNLKFHGFLQKIYADLKAAAVTGFTTDTKLQTEYETAFGQVGVHFYYVDLGSLYLGDDSELAVTLQIGAGMSAGAFGMWTVSAERRPDFMLQYDVVTDFDATHNDVDAIFLCNTGSEAQFFKVDEVTRLITSEDAVAVQIEDHNGSYLTDLMGLYTATNVFSEVEGLLDQRVTVIYRRPDPLPARVYCKVTGLVSSGGQDWRLVVRKFVVDERLVSANTIDEAGRLAARLAELERTRPAVAKALRHAGLAVKSTSVAAAAVQLQANA